jgi:hypothetical protein
LNRFLTFCFVVLTAFPLRAETSAFNAREMLTRSKLQASERHLAAVLSAEAAPDEPPTSLEALAITARTLGVRAET